MKLLAKQKTGKARLKERSMYVLPLLPQIPETDSRRTNDSGRVTIPTEAFFSVLGGQESKRKGDKKKKE